MVVCVSNVNGTRIWVKTDATLVRDDKVSFQFQVMKAQYWGYENYVLKERVLVPSIQGSIIDWEGETVAPIVANKPNNNMVYL